jgi:beta-carotene hydroxylase
MLSDEVRAQRQRERALAAPHRDHFGWRLVFEAAWGLALWSAMIVLAMRGAVPYWLACLVNGWAVYLLYMPLHEATHGNVSGRYGRLGWVDDVVGTLCSVPMWFSFHAHRPSHMRHHAFTNDPLRDPDRFMGGRATDLFGKLLRYSVIQFLLPLLAVLRIQPRPGTGWLARGMGQVPPTEDEVRIQRRFFVACLSAFVGLSLAGFFWEALLLWYLPSRVGLLLMMLIFAWLPHHPHADIGRYRDTRVTLFPMATLLCRGHNHHVLHHMFPRVPHYRLPRLFAEMRPILEERGVRIEGPLAGPAAPKLLLH